MFPMWTKKINCWFDIIRLLGEKSCQIIKLVFYVLFCLVLQFVNLFLSCSDSFTETEVQDWLGPKQILKSPIRLSVVFCGNKEREWVGVYIVAL